jgi:hypothetical protein
VSESKIGLVVIQRLAVNFICLVRSAVAIGAERD